MVIASGTGKGPGERMTGSVPRLGWQMETKHNQDSPRAQRWPFFPHKCVEGNNESEQCQMNLTSVGRKPLSVSVSILLSHTQGGCRHSFLPMHIQRAPVSCDPSIKTLGIFNVYLSHGTVTMCWHIFVQATGLCL
jgi:hypothetical protein